MNERGWAIANVDSTELFISGLITIRRLLAGNPLSYASGLVLIGEMSAFLSVSGLSFALANRILDSMKPVLRNESDRCAFKYAEISLKLHSGKRDCSHEKEVMDFYLRQGDFERANIYNVYWGWRFVWMGCFAEAEAIEELVPLLSRERFPLPLQILMPLDSVLLFNLHAYRAEKDAVRRKAILTDTRPILKRIGKYGPKFIFRHPEALRHAGTFCWVTGRPKAAMRYWKEGLGIAERLSVKPEIGRICFEVAKAFSDAKSRHKTLAKLGPEHYAKRAGEVFTEIGLDVDLKELDEWEKAQSLCVMGAATPAHR